MDEEVQKPDELSQLRLLRERYLAFAGRARTLLRHDNKNIPVSCRKLLHEMAEDVR